MGKSSSDDGFTLIETSVALIVIMVSLLGIFQVFTYAILYNAANATRSQSLAILQQQVEFLRSKKFSPLAVDTELAGTATPTVSYVSTGNGGRFRITVTVDDDPYTDGVQVDSTTTIKEITVTVRLDSPSPGWQTAVPATVVMRRTRGN